MSALEENSLTLSEQDNLKATYAAKLEDEDKVIRWGERARKVHDRVRALTPYIGARTLHPEIDGPIKVLRSKISEEGPHHSKAGTILPAKNHILVVCGEGVLEIMELQMPGGKALPAANLLRGRPLSGAFKP
jgi:methionyl-tRNA formyltransferase